MDISALNTFVQIQAICRSSDVRLVYSGVADDVRDSLVMLGAVTMEQDVPLLFEDADYAVEFMEDELLHIYTYEDKAMSIQAHLLQLFGDEEKVDLLVRHMKRVEIESSGILFEQERLQIGMVAPDIVGPDIDGVEFKLSDYRGKVVVIDFWGDW